ncbi:MFS transporter [Pseudomonas putida]|uniref:MFS transporter n=1 Tax=Pseudomonas putida TaxID=303 RepID=UPI00383AC2A2
MSSVWKNPSVLRLVCAQAMAGANAAVVYATGAVIGHTLSPDPAYATLPISIFVIGMACSTLITGYLLRRHGRIRSFMFGNACGVVVGLLAACALLVHSFALFCFAMLFGGAYAAVVLTFRFAATECVDPPQRAKALSAVMAGGVFAGVLGPQLVSLTMQWWPDVDFAATYLAAAVVAVLSALLLSKVRFAEQHNAPTSTYGRSLGELLRQPRLLVAMLCGLVSYTVMNFLMTSAPLAMTLHGMHQQDANLGIQWHIVSMYAPSFFTGSLIIRFGAARIVLLGLALLVSSAAIGLMEPTLIHFWTLLVLLGVGWNFGFLGASALILSCHRPEEKARVQSLNDFVVFAAVAVGSLASGNLLTTYGWQTVCLAIIAPILIAALIILLHMFTQRTPQVAES